MLSKTEQLTYQLIGIVRAFTESEGDTSYYKEVMTRKLMELDEAHEMQFDAWWLGEDE